MRQLFSFIVAVLLLVLIVSGCDAGAQIDLSTLERRVSTLESENTTLKSQVTNLQQSQLKRLTGTVGFVAPSASGVPLGQVWTLIKEECINFAQPFSEQPDVVLSTSQFDFVGGNGGLTYRIYTTSVTRDNFCYKAEGAYSTVNGFVFSWLAVGQK
jgi:outer membrane murein-binding lipoprotein Lpp